MVYKATGDEHYTSTVLFIDLELKMERQAPQAYSLLVKITSEEAIYRVFFGTDVLFHNEIHMYTEVVSLYIYIPNDGSCNMLEMDESM